MLAFPVFGVTSLSHLQVILDGAFGKGLWVNWEPETILFEAKKNEEDDVDPILREKVLVLQILNANLNGMLSYPEFLFRYVSVANNEFADFDYLNIPNSLELGWAIEEAYKLGSLIGEPFEITEEMKEIFSYVLREEGYSIPVGPFSSIPPESLVFGQTEEDTKMKILALAAYSKHMSDISSDSIKA